MKLRQKIGGTWPLQLALVGGLAFASGCESDSNEDTGGGNPDAGMTVDMGPAPDMGTPDMGMMMPDMGMQMSLYERLGGEGGITTVINDFVGRVLGDAQINGYFLNQSTDGNRLVTCLVKQVGALTGGPQTYPAEGEAADADGCRNMTESHEGLGISSQDFADLAGHLVAALMDAGVPQADVDAIVAAVSPLGEIIIEDADNNASIYQRVGRKPAIATVINDFIGRVVGDAQINGYFLNNDLNAARLGTCLVRQVCALTGGPCAYGAGVEAELEINGTVEVCKDMLSVHAGLGISTQDYNDLAGHLVAALTDAGAAQADIDGIVAALTDPAFVSTIVEDANNNASIYQRVGRKPAIATVINDFIGRVVADPQINGYFLNNTLNAGRLGTCLVRQVCDVAGGPCVYGEGVEPELEINGNTVVCQDMLTIHAGLGISTQDFNDLVGHLAGALGDAGVSADDINELALVVTDPSFVSTVVEDASNDGTVYQRVGRKPAIDLVVGNFITRVVANAEINGFFGMTNAARLQTCLVRQVCSIDGPCRYGEGVEPELMVGGNIVECRDMLSSHTGVVDDMGSPITIADFNSLVGDLVTELTAAGVQMADIDAILAALGPLCGDIVDGGTGCN